MTTRQRLLNALNYKEYDRLPIIHFGFWQETIQKWKEEGHITAEEAEAVYDNSPNENIIAKRLGFDANWSSATGGNSFLMPAFERRVIKDNGDGTRTALNHEGVVVLESDTAGSIPAEVDHLFKDRASWEKEFLPKLQYSDDRIPWDYLEALKKQDPEDRDQLLGLHIGSLFGNIRNFIGFENITYLLMDDEDLYDEVINTVGELCYRVAKTMLESGVKFDFAHYWEDICFKNGPLVSPHIFMEKVGPHYKKINDLLHEHGVKLISLDCDGLIDALIPTWLENGVNIMFPIEVGTWRANIAPWREKYGKGIMGVGGMDKTVFAKDKAAIDAEIERLRPLIALGGYVPCPDHRIAPDAIWENVQYYCQRMREEFA